MKNFFYPSSIAVFGVSSQYDNMAKNIVKNLIDFDFQGTIHPIGRTRGNVYGMEIRQSIDEVEGPVDLAIFLIPAKAIPEHLRACGLKGVRRVVISSGGFSEFAGERMTLEDEVKAILAEFDMRLIGPNGLGVINNEIGLCLPFVRLHRFPLGPVSLMTQSGGMGLTFIMLLTSENIGINKYVSLGNKLDVCEAELVPFLESDDKTGIIGLYLEEICRGREFMRMMRGVKKPVIVYKANTTGEGARIAHSHTAAVANDDRVVDAALKQAHVLRVSDLKHFVTSAKAMLLPPMRGNRVAVLTPTGGYAVILADWCERHGLTLPPFPEKFIKDVQSHVRAGVINMTNPMDLGDLFDMEMLAITITRAMQEENFDALVLGWLLLQDAGMAMSGAFNVFPFLEKMVRDYKKPIALCLVGDPGAIDRFKRRTSLPIFDSPEETVQALAALRAHSKWSEEGFAEPELFSFDKPRAAALISAAKKAGRRELGFIDSMELLAAAGITAAPAVRAADPEAAASAAEKLGFPVAVKLLADDVSHKSDVGGVRLGLATPDEVRAAAREMLDAAAAKGFHADGVAVQKAAAPGREVIIGAKRNEHFGPVVVFGLGGVLVEAMKDVAIRVAPLSRRDAEEMLDEPRGAVALRAFRGAPPADREALIEILLRVSSLMTACPEIAELDVNPVIAAPESRGATAVDARVIL